MKLLYITAFEPSNDSTSIRSKKYAEGIVKMETKIEITVIAVSENKENRSIKYSENLIVNYGLTQESSFSSVTNKILQSVDSIRPDIVHVFYNYVTFGSVLKSLRVLKFISTLCKDRGIKHFLTLHSIIVDPVKRVLSEYGIIDSLGNQFQKMFSLFSRVHLKRIKNHWDEIILPSVSQFEYFKSILKEEEQAKIHYIPLGFEFDEVRKLVPENNTVDKKVKTRVLFIGAIAPYKGVHNLIKAMGMLNREIDGINLFIIGRATLRGREDLKYFNKLLLLVRKLKIENVCSIRNEWLTQESIISYLQSSDLIVFPTIDDGTLSLLSSPYISLLTKKRILMTNVPRMYDYKNVKEIIFCNPSPENLFTAIYKLISNSTTQDVDYSDGCKEHEMTVIIKKYLQLYLDNISESPIKDKVKEPLLLGD